jgi:hypothetical protein
MTESNLFRDKLTNLAKELSLRNQFTIIFPFFPIYNSISN